MHSYCHKKIFAQYAAYVRAFILCAWLTVLLFICIVPTHAIARAAAQAAAKPKKQATMPVLHAPRMPTYASLPADTSHDTTKRLLIYLTVGELLVAAAIVAIGKLKSPHNHS